MDSANYLPKLARNRFKGVRQALQNRIWKQALPVEVMGGPLNSLPIGLDMAKEQDYNIVKRGEFFGPPNGGFQQRWFYVDIPGALTDNGHRALHWKCAGETTVYLNNEPYAGFDPPHPYCLLPDDACRLYLDCSTCQTWMWPGNGLQPTPFGLQFQDAFIAERDENAWEAYWDFVVLEEMLAHYTQKAGPNQRDYPEQMPPVLRKLEYRLFKLCNVLEREGLASFAKGLHALYKDFPAEYWQPPVTFCGHMHLDLIHLWPQFQAERKAVHSFANSLYLMDRYDDLMVTQSQPALYDAVKTLSPALAQRIDGRAAEHRWEHTGGMDVEADVNLPCGEALLRNFVYGQRRLAAMRDGMKNQVLWLPDCFGFSPCLPQIMQQVGITSFYTQKQLWRQVTQFPHRSFRWRGLDGTEVLVHCGAFSYNGPESTGDMIDIAQGNPQTGIHDESLLPYGHGDGGGGPTDAMCERALRWRDLACVPTSRWDTAEAFFERMLPKAKELPVWSDEISIEYHYGVYTTESRLKQVYRALERALQAQEAVRAVKSMPVLGYEAWKRLLYVQFHDCICGAALEMCFDEVIPQLERLGQQVFKAAANELEQNSKASTLCVFNLLAIKRKVCFPITYKALDLQEKTITGAGHLLAKDGMLLIQPLGDGTILVQAELKGLESLALCGPFVPSSENPFLEVSPKALDNGRLRVTFGDNGMVIGMAIKGQPVALCSPMHFSLYPDNPVGYDGWDIDRYTLSLGKAIDARMILRVKEYGPVRAVLEGAFAMGENSHVLLTYALEADSCYLRIELEAHWQESHKLLKLHLPTEYNGRVRYGAPFGSLLRTQKRGADADEAQWEVPASRWATISDENEEHGLSIITEAKYGFSCMDGNLGVSLLRAPKYPNPHSDMGIHQIRLALGALCLTETSAAQAAETLYAQPILAKGDPFAAPFTIENTGTLVPSWVAPAELHNGILLRLHETMGGRGIATLRLNRGCANVSRVNLMEEVLTDMPKNNGCCMIHYEPYQIVTLLLENMSK